MGSFADLRGNSTMMRETEGDTFANKTDEQLEELNLLAAQERLSYDMRMTYDLGEEDSALLDTYVTTYPKTFQRAFQYLQLYYFYYNFNSGEGKNYDRKFENETKYDAQKLQWPRNLVSTNPITASYSVKL